MHFCVTVVLCLSAFVVCASGFNWPVAVGGTSGISFVPSLLSNVIVGDSVTFYKNNTGT